MANDDPTKCCTIFAKVVLIIINIFYLLIGLSLSGAGIYALTNIEHFNNVVGSDFKIESGVLVAVGIITILTAVLGITAAAANLWPLLILYCFLILILIGIQIGAGVTAFVYKDEVKDRVTAQIIKFMSNYTTNQSSPVYNEDGNEVLDFIQDNFHCCGFEYGFYDWLLVNLKYVRSHPSLPESCYCHDDNHVIITQNTTECVVYPPYTLPVVPSNLPLPPGVTIPANIGSFIGFNVTLSIWKRNCQEAVVSYLRENLIAFGAVAITVAAAQIFTCFFSCGLVVCILVSNKRKRHSLRVQELAYTQMESYPDENDSFTSSTSTLGSGDSQYKRFD